MRVFGSIFVIFHQMKLLLPLLFVFLFTACVKQNTVSNSQSSHWSSVSTASLRTNFSEDWDRWTLRWGDTTGYYRTAFSEDWDNWDFRIHDIIGDIKTNFSEDWDNWRLTTSGSIPGGPYDIRIRTRFSEGWDNWEIADYSHNVTLIVRTAFSEDWDNWEVFENGQNVMDMRTNFSEDWDNWRAYERQPMSNIYRAACLFIPVFVGGLHQQGIVQ